MITAAEMAQKLAGVEEGAELFVSYRAGRPATARAVREAGKADALGVPKRWFTGRMTSKRITKSGDLVFTIFTTTRWNEDDSSAAGHYRTINPAVGELLHLEVVS